MDPQEPQGQPFQQDGEQFDQSPSEQPAQPYSGQQSYPGQQESSDAPAQSSQQPIGQPAQPSYTQPQPYMGQPQQQAYSQQAYDPNQQAAAQNPYQPQQDYYGYAPHPGLPNAQAAALGENPEKNYLITLLLAYFFGVFGVDRLYLGKIGTGVAKLLTFGGLGIWQLVDLFLIAFNKLHAKGDTRPLEGYGHNRHWVKIVAIILLVFNVLMFVIFILVFVLSAFSGTQQKAKDVSRQIDLHSVATDLEKYDASSGKYPTEQDFTDGTFQPTHPMTVLKMSDIVYTANPVGCDNVATDCASFKLSTMLADGTAYTVQP